MHLHPSQNSIAPHHQEYIRRRKWWCVVKMMLMLNEWIRRINSSHTLGIHTQQQSNEDHQREESASREEDWWWFGSFDSLFSHFENTLFSPFFLLLAFPFHFHDDDDDDTGICASPLWPFLPSVVPFRGKERKKSAGKGNRGVMTGWWEEDARGDGKKRTQQRQMNKMYFGVRIRGVKCVILPPLFFSWRIWIKRRMNGPPDLPVSDSLLYFGWWWWWRGGKGCRRCQRTESVSAGYRERDKTRRKKERARKKTTQD